MCFGTRMKTATRKIYSARKIKIHMIGKAHGSDLWCFAFLIKLLSHVKQVHFQRPGLGTTSENHPVFLPSF